MIIGITGTLGAGKGTVVELLVQNFRFNSYSMSGFITEEIKRRGLPVNRDTQTEIGNDIRKTFGPAYISNQLLARAKENGGDAVIESLRTVGEAENMKKNGAIIWAVDADIKLRYERITSRKSEKDFVSFEKFVEDERRELSNMDPTKQNISGVMRLADIVINNDGTREDLGARVEDALARAHKKI